MNTTQVRDQVYLSGFFILHLRATLYIVHSLLLKIKTPTFMTRGADISFLSAFPAESEYLYPPLTYLRPTGRIEEVTFTAADLEVASLIVEDNQKEDKGRSLSRHSSVLPQLRYTVLEVEPVIA